MSITIGEFALLSFQCRVSKYFIFLYRLGRTECCTAYEIIIIVNLLQRNFIYFGFSEFRSRIDIRNDVIDFNNTD
jgi:hypothetical protein